PGELTNSAYFASSFGFGIVRSPMELFITLALFFFLCLLIYKNVSRYKPSFKMDSNIYIAGLILLAGTAVYLILLRALGSSMRSVIFDSSLRYFRESSLIPNPPIALMHFNALLLGVCSFLIAISILIYIFSLLPERNKKETKKYFLYLLIFFQLAGIVYDALQISPQGSWFIRVLYILFTFLIAYRAHYKPEKEFYSYIAFSAAFIVALFFDFNNGQLERRTLKTSALELTRTDESRLQFLINEALVSALENPEVLKSYGSGKYFDAAAFIAWSKSSLQREGMASSITLLDWQKRILGSFGVSLEDKYRINPAIYGDDIEDLTVYNNYDPFGAAEKYISGIIPIKDGEALLGYVCASLKYSAQRSPAKEIPAFLLFRAGSISNIMDFDELKVFEFRNGRLINTFGGVAPSNAQRNYILNADFGEDNEAWLRLEFSGDGHLAYALRENVDNEERVIVASVREKDISLNLYNFFKIFFIDAVFIALFFIILYSFRIRKLRELRVTFRIQLLGSFLLISILPMVFLAVFYRNLTTDKNSALTKHDLGRMAASIERYINETGGASNMRAKFEEAYANLKFDYTVYEKNKLIYSSTYTFREIGLLQKTLNPLVYKRFFAEGYNEQIVKERVENYQYNSFYYKTKLGGKEYIINVNDIFNEIQLPITGAEIDVFLIGSYSFASILVIIFSAILASRISRPIRRLTNATMSVASGDLSFEIPENKERGEIRDLVGGFNVMIRELKKGQAEIASFERESAWREMARQVAHEVKNPLTPMKLAIQHLAAAYQDKSPKFGEIFEKVIKTSISQIDILSHIAFRKHERLPRTRICGKRNVIINI
ncbi:MAG TPA: HAMP domain-containing protein, partial [Ignavibacteriales bacterium]|nr:HAMP domain-containing protein [Ignavibacteriales bacterium]